MFTRNTIAKRVLSVINARIEKAEKEYAEVCGKIDAQFEVEVEALERKRDADKLDTADVLVRGIIG